jgi:hypothetical protein
MLGMAGREADIVCILPSALPRDDLRGVVRSITQRMIRKVEWVEPAAEHLTGTVI